MAHSLDNNRKRNYYVRVTNCHDLNSIFSVVPQTPRRENEAAVDGIQIAVRYVRDLFIQREFILNCPPV